MPRTRMMGAGLAGSSAYRTRTHGDQGGGNKLQGLPPTTNKNVNVLRNIQIKGYGESRDVVFCMNQIGGVGAVGAGNGSRTFNSKADGVKDCVPGKHYFRYFDGTCKPCSKCCYKLKLDASPTNNSRIYDLLSFDCNDKKELYLKADRIYGGGNSAPPYKLSKCLKCCANLTKYTTKNGLINNSNDHDLESCYDFGIIVYSNNTQSKYWFSYNQETQMMSWVQVDDSNDVINSGNGGPNIIGLNWTIQENCDPDTDCEKKCVKLEIKFNASDSDIQDVVLILTRLIMVVNYLKI